MKKIAILVLAALLAAPALYFGAAHFNGKAVAAETPPPSKMTRPQADALYRIGNEGPKLAAKLKQMDDEQRAILAELRINMEDLKRGLVDWDFETLEIHRRTQQASEAPPQKPVGTK